MTDIAVYLPTEDVWSDALAPWFDLAGSVEKRLIENGNAAMLASLRDAGFDFDFINAQRLAGARVEEGHLVAGPMRYRIVVLPSIETIEPAALERLRDFRRAGGVVIAHDRLPERAPGMRNWRAENARVTATVHELFGPAGAAARRESHHGDRALFVPLDPARVLSPPWHPVARALTTVLKPDFLLEEADPTIGFIHRRAGIRDIYFVANLSGNGKAVRTRLRCDDAIVKLLDPETGSAVPAPTFRTSAAFTGVILPLPPWGSRFVRLDRSGAKPRQQLPRGREEVRIIPLAGPWMLRRPGAEPIALDELRSWTDVPGYREFSGTASYSTEIRVRGAFARPPASIVLDLGEVQDIADVVINGVGKGTAWPPLSSRCQWRP